MVSTEELHSHADVALNEADLLDIRVDPSGGEAQALLRVLTLPVDGPEPDDRRVILVCRPIGRVVASLRHARWNDEGAQAQPLTLADLSPTIRRFGGTPVYGWSFFDTPPDSRDHWINRLSLDVTFNNDATDHTLTLFQEALQPPDRILDICIWFNHLTVLDAARTEIPLQEFGDGGRRWWAALNARDPRIQQHGIFPGSPWPPSANSDPESPPSA